MNMKEYLTESERTVKKDVELRRDVYKTDVDFLYDMNMFVEQSCNADLAKRSLFYGEATEKTQARGYGYMLNNKKVYDELNVRKLTEQKEEDASKHLKVSQEKIHLAHACLGLISEAGEVLEEIIKSTLEEREMDLTNLKEEGGDFLWYLALYLRTVGTDFETVAESNTAKLLARYPDKFTSEAALNRDLTNEREVLEKQSA